MLAKFLPAAWRSANDIGIGAGGPEFESQAGQIGRSVNNGLPPLRRFFASAWLWCKAAEMGNATRYTLGRNTASTMTI